MSIVVRRIAAALAMGVLGLASVQAGAQAPAYPQKPVKIIIAFGAGAGVDVAGRILADALSQQMKQSVLVENREGAGGIIGTVAAAKSPPDGYTLLFASEPLTTSHLLTSPQPYDPVKDFVPVARITTNPLLLVASNNAPYKTWKELVAYAKANPGKLSYATSGKGSSSHLETELVKSRLGIDVTDVPYKTFGPAFTDTQANRVGFFMSGYGALLPHAKGGTVRPLVIGGKKRSELLPDVPTFAEEFGVPEYEAKVWYGLLAPAGTPPDVVARIHAEVAKVLDNPEVRERYRASGGEVAILDPTQFATLVKSDTDKWTRVVNAMGVKALQ